MSDQSIRQIKKDFTVAFQLSSVSRYSRDYMVKPENVLEHTGFCAFYSLAIAARIEKKTDIKIDYKKLFKQVTFHDFDETLLGDTPRTTKYFSKALTSSFKEAESIAIKKLCDWTDIDFFDDWKNAKSGIEGDILRVSDSAAVVYKNWVEIKMFNNRSFLRVSIETANSLLGFDKESINPVLVDEVEDLRRINHEVMHSFSTDIPDFLFVGPKGD